jgi:type IV secretory pathway VirB6-like protein
MYKSIIGSAYYSAILYLSLILSISFYGFSFFIGMANFTQTELIMKVTGIGFVALLVNPSGWTFFREYAVTFFKEGIDYLTFVITSAFDFDNSLKTQTDFTDKSVLFKNPSEVITLFFNDQTQAKIWGLFFASWFGWAYVALIFLSILIFIITVANALILYLTAQIFTSILMSLAPMFIVFILFNKTKSMFDKWLAALTSFALQQVLIVSVLGFFSTLIKEIIKFVLSYRVCWEPIWVIDFISFIPTIELFSFWKIAGLGEGATADAVGTVAPGIFHILFIYLIASTGQKFIMFMTGLAEGIAGGIGASGLASAFTGLTSKLQSNITSGVSSMGAGAAKLVGTRVAGIKTEEQKKLDSAKNRTEQTQRKMMDDAGREGLKAAADNGTLKNRITAAVSDNTSEERSKVRTQVAKEKGYSQSEITKHNKIAERLRKKEAVTDQEKSDLQKFDAKLGLNQEKIERAVISDVQREAAINGGAKAGLSREEAEKLYDKKASDIGTINQSDNLLIRGYIARRVKKAMKKSRNVEKFDDQTKKSVNAAIAGSREERLAQEKVAKATEAGVGGKKEETTTRRPLPPKPDQQPGQQRRAMPMPPVATTPPSKDELAKARKDLAKETGRDKVEELGNINRMLEVTESQKQAKLEAFKKFDESIGGQKKVRERVESNRQSFGDVGIADVFKTEQEKSTDTMVGKGKKKEEELERRERESGNTPTRPESEWEE